MKKHERRSPFQAYCALWIALGCAVFAPLGCSDDEDVSTGSTGGSGGAGGTGGSAGSGTGGTAGTDIDAGAEHCGGFASLRCSEPELAFCDYDDKQACGQTDATGICMPRPATCTDDCPGVCGCNGMFYCNACEASRDGTDIHPTGTCSRRRLFETLNTGSMESPRSPRAARSCLNGGSGAVCAEHADVSFSHLYALRSGVRYRRRDGGRADRLHSRRQ